MAYFRNGRILASYAGSEGLTSGTVHGFYIDRKRTLWAATAGGLNRIHDGRVLTLTSRNGLPCDMVHWMMEDDADSVWLSLACGLVRIARAEFDAWTSDPKKQIRPTVFNRPTERGISDYNSATARLSQNLQMANCRSLPFGGLSVIDPDRLAVDELPRRYTSSKFRKWQSVCRDERLAPAAAHQGT